MLNRREVTQLLFTAGLVGATTIAAGAAASRPSRRDEISALRQLAESKHPRGFEAIADPDWRTCWDKLLAEADELSDGAYFVRARRALGWFKDGHTTILPFEFVGGVPAGLADGPFAYSLPLRVRVFHDGAWIVETGVGARSLLGARITRVGKMTAVELIRALAEQWPGNDAWAHRWSAEPFSSPAFLQALGAVDAAAAAVPFEAQSGGKILQASLKPSARPQSDLQEATRAALEREAWAASAGVGNFVRHLPDHRALYLSIEDMADLEGKTFEAFTREAFEAMAAPGVERLVVDLRRNGGGDNYLAEALRKRIGHSGFNRPGGLYVLTGPRTFSAAQNCATRLERETFATFVGEPTGGAPNHYGDATLFTGAVTGISALVSTLAWFDSYPQDRRPWILPDLPVNETFADWQAGRDAALQTALTHQSTTPADELEPSRIFYFGRESQKKDWRPFWRGS
jgi:hypothetical protein